tara:strand:+ start:586 stop:822 length:237 start_codon:yes stop_codon:yes gene_type:complete
MNRGIDDAVSAEIQILKENRRRQRMDERYDNWIEVSDEDLWEDGELDKVDVAMKLFVNIVSEGKWIVLRKLRKGESHG